MFNNLRSLFIILAAGLAFASCKKEDVAQPVAGTTGKVAATAESQSYFTTPDGAAYSYVDTTGAGISSTNVSSQKSLGDTTIGEISFAKVTRDGSHVNSYQHSANGVTTMVAYNGADKITTTVLKANEPVGAVWTDEFTSAGIPTSYKWQITEKGISKTVLGVTYDNVIKVHLLGTAKIGAKGATTAIANADYYYAPNIGLIENVGYNPVSGAVELHRVFQKKGK
ncbi:hypothetical protein BH11BAC4_BH11BAC4_08080 [soil metagenome]